MGAQKPSFAAPPGGFISGLAVLLPSWKSALAQSLLSLLSRPPRDAGVFSRCLAFALSNKRELLAEARPGQEVSVKGATADYPLVTALLQIDGKAPAYLRTLTWLALEMWLRGHDSRVVARLAAVIRGQTGLSPEDAQTPAGRLSINLGECDGVEQLIATLGQLKADGGPSFTTGHTHFDELWKGSLAGFCDLLRVAPPPVVPGIHDDNVIPLDNAPLLVGARLGDDEADGLDEPAESGFILVDSPPGNTKGMSDALRQATSGVLQLSSRLQRRSGPDLLRHPDNILPATRFEAEWKSVAAAATRAWKRQHGEGIERCLVKLLVLESGLNNREARATIYGSEASHGCPAIDLSAGALHRAECRPPGAFQPNEYDPAWTQTGGDIPFPLSRFCRVLAWAHLRLQKRLHIQSQRSTGARSVPFSPMLITREIHQPVTDAMNHVSGVVGHGAPVFRLRLTAAIAAEFGSECAQIAFGDSFGLGTAPAYYGRFPVAAIADAITRINGPIGRACKSSRRSAWPTHFIGSRACSLSNPFAEAWAIHGNNCRRFHGRPRLRGYTESWAKKREELALHLLLATGHRPNLNLSTITLADIDRTHAFLVIGDKKADAAHLTRGVSTGHRFMGLLDVYVEFLQRLLDQRELPHGARCLARRILVGEESLFALPASDRTVIGLDVAVLMASLPSPWSECKNLHRHALNQWLIEQSVAPELRHYQMGWRSGRTGAASDLSPRSHLELSLELAPFIDTWLVASGWRSGHLPSLRGCSRPEKLQDWTTLLAEHDRHGKALSEQHRRNAKARRKAVEPKVLATLKPWIGRQLPAFVLSCLSLKLSRRVAADYIDSPDVIIPAAAVKTLLACFSDPLEKHVACELLGKILKSAKRLGIVVEYMPSIVRGDPVTDVSRLPIGVGQALAMTSEFRRSIERALKEALDLTRPGQAEHELALAVWSVLAFTPHRTIAEACEITANASRQRCSKADLGFVRIPLGSGHTVVSHIPVLALGRLAKVPAGEMLLLQARDITVAQLGRFVRNLLPNATRGLSDVNAAERMVSTLHAAGEAELPGPTRLLMRGDVLACTVTAERAVDVSDNIFRPSAPALATGRQPIDDFMQASDQAGDSVRAPRITREVGALMPMFDPAYSGLIAGVPALPARSRKRQLKPLATDLLDQMSAHPTLGRALLEYVTHLLIEGGIRSAGGQAISTIYSMYHRVSPALAALADAQDLTCVPSEELTAIIEQSVVRSRRQTKIEVLDELGRFWTFVCQRYDVASPEWAVLYRQAGARYVAEDPAMVSDIEVAAIVTELARHLADTGPQADHTERRFRELLLGALLLSEASGVRPSSVYGLTLADMHLDDAGDYLCLREHGLYVSVKTTTSIGYVPLVGACWDKHRTWLCSWLVVRGNEYPGIPLEQVPLFQMPAAMLGVRYRANEVFRRIGKLLRWATGQPSARMYGLRKRRITERHRAVTMNSHATACDVARALRDSGHASIETAITAYLADPSAWIRPLLATLPLPKIGAVADIKGVSTNSLHMRVKRLKAKSSGPLSLEETMAAYLEFSPPQQRDVVSCAAPEIVSYQEAPIWRSVEAVLAGMAGATDANVSIVKNLLDAKRVASIERAAHQLEARTGLRFGSGTHELHRPRSTPVANVTHRLIADEDPRVTRIAAAWADVAGRKGFKTLTNGCFLFDLAAAKLLQQIVSESGLGLDLTTRGSNEPVRCLVIDPLNGTPYAAWRALRWMLAVAWVFTDVQQGSLPADPPVDSSLVA